MKHQTQVIALTLSIISSLCAQEKSEWITFSYSVCLTGHNTKKLYGIDAEQCEAACLDETQFLCCSCEYFTYYSGSGCFLSTATTSLVPADIEIPCAPSHTIYKEQNIPECHPPKTTDATTYAESTKDQLTTLIETTTREETTSPVTTKDRLTTVIETTKEKTTFPHVLTSLRTSNIQDTTTEIISPTFDESMSTTEAPSKEEAKNVFFAAKKATSNSPIKSTGQRQPTSLTTKTSTSIPQTKSAETPTDYASLSIFPLRELSTYPQRNMSPMVDSFVTGATTISSLSTQLTEDKSNKTTQRRLPPLKGNKLAHKSSKLINLREEPSHIVIGCSFLLADFSFLIVVFVTDLPRILQHVRLLNPLFGRLFNVRGRPEA
ncbi:hypothetical protein CAPTEDRAFT_201043 [Capitella teleta]|uniref:Apple domain-containing protein n=1 Tax=Capitella teleta TaxID=283909 RepID=R7TAP8_CAPTE|nr:hypothetical protein CAPTEDRAFT_201043 [Capitella teleta]|eukprot:ELT90779.1 hypothetical protein CAPTEDRAFT_201043 [Capitella teleta]